MAPAGNSRTRGLAVLEQLGMDEHLGLGAEFAVALAKQAIAAQVAVLQSTSQPRIGNAQVRLELDQLGGLLVVVVVDLAELLGQQQDPAVSVDDLGLEVGVFQVGAVGDRAVVGQQDGLGVLDVGEHGVGKLLAPGVS